MNTYRCDFHIHSALSPCADIDMTPANIVAMAKLKGLDAIAITDHQSCGNVLPAIYHGKKTGVQVIPGMELETAEEFHCVCLFPDYNKALKFEEIIRNSMPDISNSEEIFGQQWYFDENDIMIKQEERMLLVPACITFESAQKIVSDFDGIIIPAHINRNSYSILSVLGSIPPEYNGKCLEISTDSKKNDILKKHPELVKYKFITSSDAHYLKDISDDGYLVEIAQDNSFESVISSIIHALID